MKSLPLLRLLSMIALAAWMQVLASPSPAHAELNHDSSGLAPATAASSLTVPETSSVVLLGTLGLMLMLRRRRLHD